MKAAPAASWFVLLSFAAALACEAEFVGPAGSEGPRKPGTELRVGETTLDEIRELFPQTRGWFRIVATQQFVEAPDGRISPDYRTLTHSRVRYQDGAGHSIIPRFSARFRSPLRIGSVERPGVFVELRPSRATDVAAEIDQGLIVYPEAFPATDLVYKTTPTHTDEYLLLRSSVAPTRWEYELELGPDVSGVRQAGNAIEVLDLRGAAWLRAGHPRAIDRRGERAEGTIRIDGDRMVVELDTSSLEYPILVDPDWKSTGDMSQPRFFHAFTILDAWRIVATGGCSSSFCSGDLRLPVCKKVVSRAEILDLPSRTFLQAADGEPRFMHAAHRLVDGTILVAGGCTTGSCEQTTASAEVFDPLYNDFFAVGSLAEARAGMSSAELDDGRILLAGGCTLEGCTTRVEAYELDSDGFLPASPLAEARGRAATVLLEDGRVLVAGGCTDLDCTGKALSSAEIYDPDADSWASVGSMNEARAGHFAVLLFDGRVLVGGGCGERSCSPISSSAEIFDPSIDEFVLAPSMLQPRLGSAAVTLVDGTVLVSQGCSDADTCDLTTELFDPGTVQFQAASPALTGRGFHELVLHEVGQVVIANGGCQPDTCSWWNETYDISDLVPVEPDPGTDDGGHKHQHDQGAGPESGDETGSGPPAPGDGSSSSGCGCVVDLGGSGEAPTFLLLAASLWGLGARRRSSRR